MQKRWMLRVVRAKDVERFVELRKQGLTYAQIAKKTDWSLTAVYLNCRAKLGMCRRPNKVWERIREMAGENYTVRMMADELGKSPGHIWSAIYRMGIQDQVRRGM